MTPTDDYENNDIYPKSDVPQTLDKNSSFWYDTFERQVIDMIIWLDSGISVVHFLSDAVGR